MNQFSTIIEMLTNPAITQILQEVIEKNKTLERILPKYKHHEISLEGAPDYFIYNHGYDYFYIKPEKIIEYLKVQKEKAERMYHRYLTEKLLIGEIEVTLSYRTSEGAFLFARKIKKYRSYEKWI